MTPREASQSVLIVDDDERLRSRLARAFHDRGYQVHQAEDVATAAAVLHEHHPERVVVDLRIGAESGLAVVATGRATSPDSRIVVLKDGKIEEVGTHDELLEKKGEFHRLVEMQQEMSKIREVGR